MILNLWFDNFSLVKNRPSHIRNIDALECVVAASTEFQFKSLLKKRKPEMVTDMIYWFLQLKHLFLYAGTRGHVVDIINTFFFVKPLLLTVLEVAKKLSKPQT